MTRFGEIPPLLQIYKHIWQYIQGLFDAEGCIYLDKNKQTKFYISITQKKYPFILNKIKDFLGFGQIDKSNIVLKIFNKNDCLNFISLIKKDLIVKYNQIIAFEYFLINYDDENHKICYKRCEYFDGVSIRANNAKD